MTGRVSVIRWLRHTDLALVAIDLVAVGTTLHLLGRSPLGVLAYVAVLLIADGYRRHIALPILAMLPRLVVAYVFAAALVEFFAGAGDRFVTAVLDCGVVVAVAIIARIAYVTCLRTWRTISPKRLSRTAIIGGQSVTRSLVRAAVDHRQVGINPVVIISSEARDDVQALGIPIETNVDDIAAVAARYNVQTVIVTDPDAPGWDPVRLLADSVYDVYVVPHFFGFMRQQTSTDPEPTRTRMLPLLHADRHTHRIWF